MIVEAVLAVGYDSQSYYVKNSWGTWWGEQGYIRMGRYPGDTGYGKCGILMQPSQPVACSLAGPGPAPAPLKPVIAFRRGAGFLRPCLVTSHQGKYKAMTQRLISWPSLVIKLIEKGGYLWSVGMADKYMLQRGDNLIDIGCVGETST